MWDWLDEIINLGADAADVGGDQVLDLVNTGADAGGGDWFFDTATGELVTADQMQQIMDLDLSGSGSGPLGSDFTGALDTSPISTSTSDMLRSIEGSSPGTTAPGREPFDWNAMADPSASIASAGSSDWTKALAQGLSNALGGLSGGLKGLQGDGSGGVPSGGSLPGMLGGGSPNVLGDLGGGGLQGLLRAGDQGPIGAAYSETTPNPSAKYTMQSPIDAGPAPRPFTPLALPTAGGGVPMAGQSSAPRMSGLQRLLLEKLG
jgi:hypothetical protein